MKPNVGTIKKGKYTIAEITLSKASKVYWKPVIEPHWESFCKMTTQDDHYQCQHLFAPTIVQIFWLKFTVIIKIGRRITSQRKFADYRAADRKQYDDAEKF